jgi:predicted P-loop ATPase
MVALSILPAPPEGLRVIRETHARQDYIATGFYPPGVSRDSKSVEFIPAIVADADLADYIVAKLPHFLLLAASNEQDWLDNDKDYALSPLVKKQAKFYPDEDLPTAVRLMSMVDIHKSAIIKSWLHAGMGGEFYDELLEEQRKYILGLVEEHVRQLPTVMTISGYGHHLLWWLPDGTGARSDLTLLGAANAVRFNKKLIDTVNRAARFQVFDPAVSDPGTRLLREIGSRNTKGRTPIPVEPVIYEPARRLNLLKLELANITAHAAVLPIDAAKPPRPQHENPAIQRLLDARERADRERVLGGGAGGKVPTLPPDMPLDYGEGKITAREWLKEAKDGDALSIKCPFAGSETVGSAKLYVSGSRAMLCCWAGHHNHDNFVGNRALWAWTPSAGQPAVLPDGTEPEPKSDEDIRSDLIGRFATDSKGKVDPTSRLNKKLILIEDPTYAGKVWFCERRLQIRFDEPDGSSRAAVDDDFFKFMLHCERYYGFKGGDFQDTMRLFNNVARLSRRNPLKDWLHSLRWDGTARLDELLIRVTGCPDTPLHRAYSRRYLISLVARVFEPGCQVDQVLLLTGTQGAKKTSFFRELVTAEWFGNNHMDISNKDSVLQMVQVWLWEWQENAKKGAEVAAERAFITTTVDLIRPPYGASILSIPRHTVFAATSNDNEPLRDPDGTRRWWVVRCADMLDIDYLKEVREQVFAEAAAAYAAGEIWYIPKGSDLDELRIEQAESFRQDDPELEKLLIWSRSDVRAKTALQIVEIGEACFGWSAADTNKRVTVLSRLLRQAGWTRLKRTREGTQRIVRWASPVCDGLSEQDFDSAADYAYWTKLKEANKPKRKEDNVIPMRRK